MMKQLLYITLLGLVVGCGPSCIPVEVEEFNSQLDTMRGTYSPAFVFNAFYNYLGVGPTAEADMEFVKFPKHVDGALIISTPYDTLRYEILLEKVENTYRADNICVVQLTNHP